MVQGYTIPVSILLDNIDCAIKYTKEYFSKESLCCTVDKKTIKGYPVFIINKKKYILKVFYYGESLIEHPLPYNFRATPPLKKVNIHLTPM